MKTVLMAAMLATGLTSVSPALAQDWNRGGYDRGQRDDYRDHRGRDRLCQGERAQSLYLRIRREVQQRDIDWRRARDIRAAVDRTAEMERRNCARGMNAYQAQRIDRQYDRIEDMIRREARG